MEQEIIYNLEFTHLYLDIVNFKQKQVSLLQGCIFGGSLNDFMRFESYGYISFDDNDHKHQFPNVQLMDRFTRLKCNCLIYKLSHNSHNNGIFDKCFIYQTWGKNNNYYGFLFYNSKTHEMSNRCLLDDAYDSLCIKLTQSFNTMASSTIYNFYGKKYDCIKERNGNKQYNCPGVKDYDEMMKSYEERLKIPITWD